MEKEIQKKQIEDMYNVVRDVLKNWWVILFIAISVSLLTYIGAAWMYLSSDLYLQHNIRGVGEGIEYGCVCESEPDGEINGYISVSYEQSDPEEESVRESEDGYISGDGEDCCCTGDESSDGVCDERFPGDIVQAS